MNTMRMPGFTGEASLYRTDNHYRFAAGSGFVNNGSANIIPQDCGFWKTLECGFFTAATEAACALLCLSGAPPVACYGCVVGVGGLSVYINCKDCLPGWLRDILNLVDHGGDGGGGGGGSMCCPHNQICSCGGRCVNVNGQLRCVDGTCLGPNQECP
jgi:hypothetical protein